VFYEKKKEIIKEILNKRMHLVIGGQSVTPHESLLILCTIS